MSTETTPYVIELTPVDSFRLLALAQREAAQGKIWDEYWANIARQILEQLERQRRGEFMQCALCHHD